MKSMRWITLIAVTSMILISGGCISYMPDWLLHAHVDGYNRLHPDHPVETGVNK